jgi:hypothetical protein
MNSLLCEAIILRGSSFLYRYSAITTAVTQWTASEYTQMRQGATYQAATNCYFNAYSRNLGNYLDKVIFTVSVGIYHKTCNEVEYTCSNVTEPHQNRGSITLTSNGALYTHTHLSWHWFHNTFLTQKNFHNHCILHSLAMECLIQMAYSHFCATQAYWHAYDGA